MRWLKRLWKRMRPMSHADVKAECDRILECLPLVSGASVSGARPDDFAELVFVSEWTPVTTANAQEFSEIIGQPVVDAIVAAQRYDDES